MTTKNAGGRPAKFNRVDIAKIKALISGMSRKGEKITWDYICENVNREVCPNAPTTKKTLRSVAEIKLAYDKAKTNARGNTLHLKTYVKYSKERLLEVISKLEANLQETRDELIREKERKIIEFEAFLSRPQNARFLKGPRGPKFFEDLKRNIHDGSDPDPEILV